MVLDVGRVKHRADLMHKSVGSNGLAIPSNWRLSADGLKNVVWTPDSGGGGASVSFGSNSTDITTSTNAGASTNAAREDHRHRGVRAITANGSNTLFGNVDLQAGSNIALGVTGQVVTITSLASGGSGGGGGSPGSDYVSGATGTGQIIIPGMAGSPDIRVAAANDDEFDTTDTSDPMTGWTTLGSPTHNINSTAKSHYYVSASVAAHALSGIYKAMSPPFTVTCKITDGRIVGGSVGYRAALFVGEASPGKIESIGFGEGGSVIVDAWTTRTSYGSQISVYATALQSAANSQFPVYFRIVAASSTNVSYYQSHGGLIWSPMPGSGVGHNPGFTIGSVGLYINPFGVLTEALFDWIRFS